jgi:biopolymer transport protein ExbD
MAMLAGKAADINVTPMIDILLVLLIIFMMIQSGDRGEEALIPQPPTNPHDQPPDPDSTVVLELHVTSDTQPALALNRQPVAWEDLRNRLFDIYKKRAERVLFIKADDGLEFEPVAEAIDLAHSAYPDIKVGLITARIAGGT